MYSMVLMAALTTAPDVTAGGYGCGGCSGVVVSAGCNGGCTGGGLLARLRARFSGGRGSCYGSSCHSTSCHSSCYSTSCYSSSCYGSSCHSSCHSTSCYSSSCYSSSCYSTSCYSSSCYSSHRASCYGGSCYGGSCFGSSCFGSSCFGSSCFGSSHYPAVIGGCTGGVAYPTGGCIGGGAVYYGSDFTPVHASPVVIGSAIVEPTTTAAKVTDVTIDNTREAKAAEVAPAAAPARLTVELPASAKLYVDGSLVKGDTATRNFHTPDLTPGRSFYYDLKAEVEVGGKTVTEEKRVTVKAGSMATESFGKLLAAVKGDKTDAVAAK